MARWRGSWARLARRRPWLVGVLAAVAALAVVVPGLAGARYVTGWLVGPRSIGIGTEGADALAVSPDGRVLYAANWGEDAGDSSGITVVNLATGRAGQRIGIGGGAVMLAIMPGGRALYALVEQDDNSARLVSYRLVRVGLATLRTEGRFRSRLARRRWPCRRMAGWPDALHRHGQLRRQGPGPGDPG